MQYTRRAVLGAVTATIGLSGCLGGGGSDGGGGDGGSDTTPTPTATATDEPTGTPTSTGSATSASGATVGVDSHSDLGDVLVGPDGLTLYMFDRDTKGEAASTCSGDCADAWPPLTVDGEPTAGEDVTAELTTFEREGGGTQVAAGGWPLYYFANDAEPGDVNGQGVGGVWWVLAPDGAPRRPESTATPTPTSGGDGGGGGGGGGGGVY